MKVCQDRPTNLLIALYSSITMVLYDTGNGALLVFSHATRSGIIALLPGGRL